MKKQTKKELCFNKKTITSLNSYELNMVIGGSGHATASPSKFSEGPGTTTLLLV